MNFDGRVRNLGRVRIAPLLDALCDLTDADWTADPFRQRTFEVHRATRSIRLVWSSHSDLPRLETRVLPPFAHFEAVLAPIFRAASARLGIELGIVSAMFAKLPAGTEIPQHVDVAELFGAAHRLHVPLVTHPDVQFVVDGERLPLKRGSLYEINNRRRHGVVNTSPIDRIHLVFDALPS